MGGREQGVGGRGGEARGRCVAPLHTLQARYGWGGRWIEGGREGSVGDVDPDGEGVSTAFYSTQARTLALPRGPMAMRPAVWADVGCGPCSAYNSIF